MAIVEAGFVSLNVSAEFERVDISDDPAALRHRFSNDSSPNDPLDLEVQHTFQRKDDDAAQSEAGSTATPKESRTNQNA